jgi:hypothetical protein
MLESMGLKDLLALCVYLARRLPVGALSRQVKTERDVLSLAKIVSRV